MTSDLIGDVVEPGLFSGLPWSGLLKGDPMAELVLVTLAGEVQPLELGLRLRVHHLSINNCYWITSVREMLTELNFRSLSNLNFEVFVLCTLNYISTHLPPSGYVYIKIKNSHAR